MVIDTTRALCSSVSGFPLSLPLAKKKLHKCIEDVEEEEVEDDACGFKFTADHLAERRKFIIILQQGAKFQIKLYHRPKRLFGSETIASH